MPNTDIALFPARRVARQHRGRVHGLLRRVAAGADLLRATRRFDLARMMVSWGDLRRH